MSAKPQAPITDLPYEKQEDTPTNRKCGAASLCMVYRSFGMDCTQADVWERIARRGSRGAKCARTYLLAEDALKRGLSALVLQARDPWTMLRNCAEQPVRVILNHRIEKHRRDGHYSVLVAIDSVNVTLHDPQLGPARTVPREEFLTLWQSGIGFSEVTGSVLVVIAQGAAQASTCATCAMPLPATHTCRKCEAKIVLQPAAILGCGQLTCTGRTWTRLYCPSCDACVLELKYPKTQPNVVATE